MMLGYWFLEWENSMVFVYGKLIGNASNFGSGGNESVERVVTGS